MSIKTETLKAGKWYRDYTIPCEINIILRDNFIYLQHGAPGKKGVVDKEEGPFRNVNEAEQAARRGTNGTLRWS